MNTYEVEARETLKTKGFINVDENEYDEYLYFNDNLQVCFDEYVTDRFEDTLELDFPVSVENLKKLMHDNGVWVEYVNQYFNDFYHMFKMRTDEKYNWKHTDHTPTYWEEYLSDLRSYL